MIRNYLKIAWRNLYKNKLYSMVNLAGLSIGVVGCLLIGIYIHHEWSYDRFHDQADRTARVTWKMHFSGTTDETALTGTKVGPEFSRRFPEVTDFVRLLRYPEVVKFENRMFEEKNFVYADSSFFDIFSFRLLQGNPNQALDQPNELVMTSSMARKYFGQSPAFGKTVKVGGNYIFTVTGIVADPPKNSQIQFDFLASFTSLNASSQEKWSEANYYTYLLLEDRNSFQPLQEKIHGYMEELKREGDFLQGEDSMTYLLEPLTRVHLYSKLQGLEPGTSAVYLWILGGIALLILVIACVNYTNMSIAQSAGRSSEIGMRKVMGAGTRDIFGQFIAESVLLSFLAVATALLLALLLLPYFNQLSGKEFTRSVLFDPVTLAALGVLGLLTALLAGAYPALVLSRGKIISILKNGYSFSGSPVLRKCLIIFQFVISLFLIISTVFILEQLSFIQDKDLGYDKDQVVILPVDFQMRENYDALVAAIENINGISSVSGAYEPPTDIGWSDRLTARGGTAETTINALPTDGGIVETLNLNILAGGDFTDGDRLLADPEKPEDLQYTYMLNESAARALGWTPQEAVGKRVSKGREGIVRAVIEDFHYRSLHEPIGPLVIFIDNRMVQNLLVKVEGKEISATLEALERLWEERVPHRPFEYEFLDEDYEAMYRSEARIAGVFTTFSLVAIILACLGLFALTAYATLRRTKEIGIRKVLGATVADILALVSKDFLVLILIAVVIALPVSFFAVREWLENFTYHVELRWWIFVAAGLVILIVATLTVCAQAFRAALSNPVRNLKTE